MSETHTEFEVLEPQPAALESLARAEVDMQIATARKWPRSLSQVKNRMLSFATLDEDTASGCFYTLPARKGGDGKPLQGPSVRLAEIAINSFQHIRAGSRIISDDGKFITAQGVVHDLENNVCVSIEVKRRVTSKSGQRFSDDMIATTGNAACSIALRNAAFRVIPLALVKPVYEAAKRLAIGDGRSLVQRRSACIAHFAKMGVPAEKVCAAVNVRSPDDIQLEQLEVLMGYATAIKDGETSVDEVFSPKPQQAEDTKPNFTRAAKEGTGGTPAEVPAGGGGLAPTVTPTEKVSKSSGLAAELSEYFTAGGYAFAQARDVIATLLDLPEQDKQADSFAMLSPETLAYVSANRKAIMRGLAGMSSPQRELADVVTAAGFTFEEFRSWGDKSGNIRDADSIGSFEELPTDDAKRFLRSKTGLLANLSKGKGVA